MTYDQWKTRPPEEMEPPEPEFCGDSFGGLDCCMKFKGHGGNHVGLDATWRANSPDERAEAEAAERDAQ